MFSPLFLVISFISIHAPARGATLYSTVVSVDNTVISIHAPARGATRGSCRAFCALAHFNPRTREGCDGNGNGKGTKKQEFQSTHPRGVRRLIRPNYGQKSPFQSTHPRGVRPSFSSLLSPLLYISIHAPARGATVFFCKKTHNFIIFMNKNDNSAKGIRNFYF